MDKTMALKNIELHLDMTQVLQTLINIVTGMKDKENLIELLKVLAIRELEVYKVEASLREKLLEIAGRFYENRIADYRQSLKHKKLFSFLRESGIEKQSAKLAYEDTKVFIDALSGKEKIELLQGGRRALQDATEELLSLLRSSRYDFDAMQIAGRLKHAIQ